ncbi:putative LOC102094966 [Columba livia]|uniref:Putative LOC102094966 n=1 Tax=Columba livia TaxID=8932 RepID=A0A2I0MPZ3_COLLI|nr:putative LOC102094966 [Columba livia]
MDELVPARTDVGRTDVGKTDVSPCLPGTLRTLHGRLKSWLLNLPRMELEREFESWDCQPLCLGQTVHPRENLLSPESPCQQRKPALELPYSSENLRAGYQECVCWSLPQPLSARDRILCFGHVSLLSSHPAVPVQPRPFLQLFLNYSSSNPSSGYSSTQFASSCHLHKVRCGICVELCYIAQGCVGFFLLNRQLVYVYARLKILSLDAHSFPENYFPYEWLMPVAAFPAMAGRRWRD